MKYHNFKPLPKHEYKDQTKKAWWCADCDSIILMPPNISANDVNKFANIGFKKFPCLPPIQEIDSNADLGASAFLDARGNPIK